MIGELLERVFVDTHRFMNLQVSFCFVGYAREELIQRRSSRQSLRSWEIDERALCIEVGCNAFRKRVRSQEVPRPQSVPDLDSSTLTHELSVRFLCACQVRIELRQQPSDGQEIGSILQSGGRSIAAPPPISRRSGRLYAYRVEDNVPS